MNVLGEPIVDLLGRLQPTASLSRARREGLAHHCKHETMRRDHPEFGLADWPGQLVYLLRGELRLGLVGGGFEVLVGASPAALHPLGSGRQSMPGCKPITDIDLLRIDEEPLDLLLAWEQSCQARPDSAAQALNVDRHKRMPGRITVRNLARSAFAQLPAANIERLLECFTQIAVKRGDVIVRAGEPGDFYYLIESGRCQVTRRVGGADMEIADLKPGDVFGEEALLADTSRNATVTMKTDGLLLRLPSADFFELLREPLLHRLGWSEANQRVAGGAQWIDVRFPAEFGHDGLPGAINVPLNEIRRSALLLDAKREYVAYCQSGRRSAAAAFLLSQRGLNVSVLAGGLRGRPPTTLETMTQ